MPEQLSPYLDEAQQFKIEREKTEWTEEEAEMVEAVRKKVEGMWYFKEANVTAATITDHKSKSCALIEIAKAEAEAGEIEQAKKIFEQTTTKDNDNTAIHNALKVLIEIAKAEAKAGETEQAEKTLENAKQAANMITDEWDASRALIEIAKVEAEAVGIEQAKKTFEQSKQLAEKMSIEHNRVSTLIEIAKAEAKAGETEQANKTFEQAKQLAKNISNYNEEYGVDFFGEIAIAEAKAGEIEQAKQIAMGIKENSFILLEIATTEAMGGKFDQAKQTANMITFELDATRALIEIAKAEAEAGEIEQAKKTFEQSKQVAEKISIEYNRVWSLIEIAKAEAKAGETEQAEKTLENAKQTANMITSEWDASRALKEIAKAEAEAGEIEQAKKTFEQSKQLAEKISIEYNRVWSLIEIAKAEAKAGETEQAEKTFEHAKQLAKNISNYNEEDGVGFFGEIAIAEAEVGEFNQAILLALGIEDEEYQSEVLLKIAIAEAKKGSLLLKKFQIQNKNLSLQQKEALVQKASSYDSVENKEFIKFLGAIIDEKERKDLAEKLGDKVKDLLYAGYASYGEVKDEDAGDMTKYYSKRLRELSEEQKPHPNPPLKGDGTIQQENLTQPLLVKERSSKHENRLVNEILRNLGNEQAVQAVLESAREMPADNEFLPRILKTLCEIDNVKASDLAVQFCGSKELPDRIVWYTVNKLVEQGYLPASLGEYLKDKNSKDKRLLSCVREVISKLRLNPDADVLKYILDREYKDENGERIEDIDAIVENLKEKKEGFEKIDDRFELVKNLHKDKDAAILYYLLYGGRTRFSLVNSYNSEKFATILKVINDGLGEINNDVMKRWEGLMKNNTSYSDSEKEIKQMEKNLIDGKWIFEGIKAKDREGNILSKQPENVMSIRIDVSDSGRLKDIERKSANVFGKEQLGAIIKTSLYSKFLKETSPNPSLVRRGRQTDENSDLLKKINELQGLTGSEAVIAEIEEKYPDFLDRAEVSVAKNWKKLGEKNILDLSLLSVLKEDRNSVEIKKIITNLEKQRKALKNSLTQKFNDLMEKNKDRKAEFITEKRALLERLEGKDPAKLFEYIAGETIGEENLTDISEKMLSEWGSHLKEVFDEYEQISQSKGKIDTVKSEEVTLRYLDKRKNLIECLRFADSAQCCFTSTQYRMEGHNVGNAEWIARIWKDPLSYVYQIEKTPKDAEKREAIGFVFGFMGETSPHPSASATGDMASKGEGGLAVMLNGVYMQKKTDTAAASILSAIENNMSRSLQAERQAVASRHGGTIKVPSGYENTDKEITRLRALSEKHSQNPEEKIYDDLGTGVNKSVKVDDAVWFKEL